MPYKDPAKQKEAQHQHYIDYKEKYQEAAKKAKRNRAKWFRELKKTLSCSKCNETRWQCLDFHHPDERTKKRKTTNGTKITYSISYLVGHNGKKVVLKAIEECIILCANCHRMEHWDEDEQSFN